MESLQAISSSATPLGKHTKLMSLSLIRIAHVFTSANSRGRHRELVARNELEA